MYDIRHELGLSVVRQTARHSTSRLCGFIVYGIEHANVRRVLDDEHYWDEFDEISGPNWPIFSLRPLESKERKWHFPSFGSGGSTFATMYMIHSIPITHKEEPDTNRQVLDFLGIDDSSLAPCFVLFTWDDRNNLVSTAYKFNFGTVDEVHNELRGLIEAISNAERHHPA